MLQFDKHGYLMPYDVIETDLMTFEQYFAFNTHRLSIFKNYVSFVEDIKELLNAPFYQWIDGSYISLSESPKDIDVVSFIDSKAYFEKEVLFNSIKNKYQPIVDSYRICIYPENNRKFVLTQFDIAEWRYQFLTDRNKKSKGIIQINFD